jgi:hypothetical protein
MGAAAPKPPLAIHPHSKLRGIVAFSHKKTGRAKNPPRLYYFNENTRKLFFLD